MPARLAIFDFDGTLIPNPSSEWRFVHFLIRRRRVGFGALLRSLAFAVRWWPRYGRQVMKKNKAYLGGITVAEAEGLAREFVPRAVLPLLRPELIERLRQHQARGDAVAVLTGTLSFIAGPVCAALQIEQCVACECEARNGWFLPAPPVQHPFGPDKLALAQKLCKKLGYTMAQVTAYADSGHDAILLAAAGEAVAVSPDRTLRKLARQRNWEIVG